MRSKAHLGVDSRTKLIQPVIVVQTLTDSAVTIAASYAAKAYGIKTGALVREARRLCPAVIPVEANHRLYAGSLHESALSVRHLGRSMNGLRAGMAAPHVSDVPRAYVYRASPEPPQSTQSRPSVSWEHGGSPLR